METHSFTFALFHKAYNFFVSLIVFVLKMLSVFLKLLNCLQNFSGRYPYKTSGYQSEPEPNYDSDYSIVKYRTGDRRRLQSVSSAANVRDEK